MKAEQSVVAEEVSAEPSAESSREPVRYKKRKGDPGVWRKAKSAGLRAKKGPSDGASQQLVDMRHVYLNGEEFDRTEGQRQMRRFSVKDTKGFGTMMARLEREHREEMRLVTKAEEAVVQATTAEAEPDVGTERCVEMCEKLLRELTTGGKP